MRLLGGFSGVERLPRLPIPRYGFWRASFELNSIGSILARSGECRRGTKLLYLQLHEDGDHPAHAARTHILQLYGGRMRLYTEALRSHNDIFAHNDIAATDGGCIWKLSCPQWREASRHTFALSKMTFPRADGKTCAWQALGTGFGSQELDLVSAVEL